MKTKLYKSDSFTNKNIPFLFNKEIIEYDMKDAGFSLSKEFNLLPKETIDKLEKMKKKQRTIEIGLIQRSDETYKKELAQAFKDARKLFFEFNEIEDSDVISIKKDAIFLNKKCKVTQFGEYINFRPKNEYTSFIQLDKLEFYYAPDVIDIKGISDELLALHSNGILKFVISFFKKMEVSSDIDVIEFTKRYIDKYKNRKLPVDFYREFNFKSKFKTLEGEVYDEYWEENKDELDISYNFINIFIKFIQIPL